MSQEMSQWVIFVKKNSCNRFYSKTESLFDLLVVVGFSLQGRNWSKPCTENVSPEQKKKTHGHHM